MNEQRFMSIREVARTKILPENALRQMVRDKKIAGIYIGTKFLIDYPLLLEWLDKESRKNMEPQKGA